MTDLAVARSFGRSASSYDAHAHVQHAAGLSLLGMLPLLSVGGLAVDLGAGTVPLSRRLSQQQPLCRWLALDISHAMLAEAEQRGRLEQGWHAVCADAENMPLADASVSLIYSCFALQWCSAPSLALAEMARVLAPGGQAVLAVPVAGSLQEFRDSWEEVDGSIHFNALPAAAEWVTSSPELDLHHSQQLAMREYYSDVRGVVSMLKSTGANRVRGRKSPGLMTPGRYQALVRSYEARRVAQGLPLTWQVLYMSIQKKG